MDNHEEFKMAGSRESAMARAPEVGDDQSGNSLPEIVAAVVAG